MNLWNKTILSAGITLLFAGCDNADKKVDSNLNKAKKPPASIKNAAADKASAIKDEADKHIDALKQGEDEQAEIKVGAKQKSDQVVVEKAE